MRSSVHLPAATLWAHFQGGDVDAGLAELEEPAGVMIDDLLWWTRRVEDRPRHRVLSDVSACDPCFRAVPEDIQ